MGGWVGGWVGGWDSYLAGEGGDGWVHAVLGVEEVDWVTAWRERVGGWVGG